MTEIEPTQREDSQEISPSDIAEALNQAVPKARSIFARFSYGS